MPLDRVAFNQKPLKAASQNRAATCFVLKCCVLYPSMTCSANKTLKLTNSRHNYIIKMAGWALLSMAALYNVMDIAFGKGVITTFSLKLNKKHN